MKTIHKALDEYNNATIKLHNAIANKVKEQGGFIKVCKDQTVSMYAYIFDYYTGDYVEEVIYALATDEFGDLKVLTGYFEDSDDLIKQDSWYHILGGELSIAATLLSIAENLSEYINE